MPEIRIYDAANNFAEITADFLPKLRSLSIRESLLGEADSITISLVNNPAGKNYWSNDYFQDREISLKIIVDGVNFGIFNFDEIDFDFSENGEYISMKGLIAPVTTGKSIYQQIRKVWSLANLSTILKQIAAISDLEINYLFDEFKLKLQIQNEFLFNIFTRLAMKYGAVTKIYREIETDKYKILFFGKKDIAENAAILKQSEIAQTLGRGKGFISFDKENPDKKRISLNFRLLTARKELKVVYYNPENQRTYSKISKNKSNLIVEDSRQDHDIVKVTSQQEADIVARKVELEPTIEGDIMSRWDGEFLSGNIIEFKNFKTLSGYYLITDSNHSFSDNGNESSCSFERLPDTYFQQYLSALN